MVWSAGAALSAITNPQVPVAANQIQKYIPGVTRGSQIAVPLIPDQVTPGSMAPLAQNPNLQPMSTDARLQTNNADFAQNLDLIHRNEGNQNLQYSSDYLEKAEQLMNKANQFNTQAVNNIINNKGQSSSASLKQFMRAIAQRESSGNYRAVNKSSGALGKYQILPSNIAGPGGWDKEALGYNISPHQYLTSRKLQDAIATYKLGQYYRKYGVAGAASAWYSGRPNAYKNSNQVNTYVQAILNALGM